VKWRRARTVRYRWEALAAGWTAVAQCAASGGVVKARQPEPTAFGEKATWMTENGGSAGELVPGFSADKDARLLRTHATKSPSIASTTPNWSKAGWPKAEAMRLPTTHRPTPTKKIAYNAPQWVRPGVTRSSRDKRIRRVESLAGGPPMCSIVADFIEIP